MIRSIGPEEWERFRELRLEALREAPDAFGSTLERELSFDETAWRSRLAARRQLVAIVGGEWVGTAGAILAENGPGAELVSMWVAPSARGTGVAAELVTSVLGWATGEGHSRLSLWVADGNERAERLYHRLGFRRTGRREPIRAEEPDRLEVEMAIDLPR